MITAFNEGFYGVRPDTQGSLADVAYCDKVSLSDSDNIFKTVVDTLLYTTWRERYGLGYHETMELTYHEWIALKKALTHKEDIDKRVQDRVQEEQERDGKKQH